MPHLFRCVLASIGATSVAAVAGCGLLDPEDPISVRYESYNIEQSEYGSFPYITYRVVNNTDGIATLSRCGAPGLVSAGEEDAEKERPRICGLAFDVRLAAGETQHLTRGVRDLEPGRYRVAEHYTQESDPTWRIAWSDEFEIP
jgi:hypothetical protein